MADVQLIGVVAADAAAGAAASTLAAAPAPSGGGGTIGKIPDRRPVAAAQAPNKDQLKSAVADANEALAAIGTQLVFVFDDQAHHMAVKLLDIQTQKVVQEVLPKAMLNAVSALSGSASSGALVDTKA